MSTHANTTVEWQLEQLPAGADVVIKDEAGRLVARGTVNPDRVSLKGPGGDRVPILSGKGWTVKVLKMPGPPDREKPSRPSKG